MQSFDTLIIGSGLAGLSLALRIAAHKQVCIVSKRTINDTASDWAQGGIAAVLNEGDTIASHIQDTLIAGAGLCDEAVTTLVERKSRVVLLIKNTRKYSDGVMSRIAKKFETWPQKMCKTMTFDQGSEFAAHKLLEQQLRCKVYYCHAHSPWQKGSNENMNGRLRRYLPSSTDIALVSQEELDALAVKMNRCPRKCLGFKTPNELLIQQIKNNCRTWR